MLMAPQRMLFNLHILLINLEVTQIANFKEVGSPCNVLKMVCLVFVTVI